MQNRWFKLMGAPLALSAATLLTACSESGSTGAGRGTLSLAITDAPFPYAEVDSAIVYVVRIDARQEDATEAQADSGATETRRDGEEDGRHGGWVTLATPDRGINLLDLQNGKVMNLGEQSLPTGTYKGFRLVIDPMQSRIVLKDGSKPEIKWPSAARSGIKVKLEKPIAVVAGETLMVIDFDLAGSFVLRGNSIRNNGLLFKPVVRGIARDVAGGVAGTVRGDSAAGAVVAGASVQLWKQLADTAVAGSVPLATAGTDAAGAYKIAALLPGDYAVRVLAADTLRHTNGLTGKVTVTTGATVTANVILPTKK